MIPSALIVPALLHKTTMRNDHNISNTTKSIAKGGVVRIATKRPKHNTFRTTKSVSIHLSLNIVRQQVAALAGWQHRQHSSKPSRRSRLLPRLSSMWHNSHFR